MGREELALDEGKRFGSCDFYLEKNRVQTNNVYPVALILFRYLCMQRMHA